MRTTDPFFLHGLDIFRPVRQFIEIVDQPVGIVGNFEIPLGQFAFDHRGIASLAFAVDHLFVGQNGFIFGTPVNQPRLAVCQPLFEQLNEHPLRPFVIFGTAGDNLARPVKRYADLLQGFAGDFDIVIGPVLGMKFALNRGSFRRKTECVPSERMQDVLAEHHMISGDRVADYIIAKVSHVNITGGIREHDQHVEFIPVRFVDRPIESVILPGFLPAAFDLLEIVSRLMFFGLLHLSIPVKIR